MNRTTLVHSFAVIALASLLSACPSEHSAEAIDRTPVNYVGSSTIGEHIIPDAGRAFAAQSSIPFGSIQIQGSGKGLDLVVRGEAELAGVSRSLSDEEGKKQISYQIIGYDAIALFVHPSNPVTSLTKHQLKGIYTGEVKRWSELGGRDEPILCITQIWGEKRAQMVEFQQQVMDGLAYREDRVEYDMQPEEIAVLASEPNGISALSFAFATSAIKTVALEGFAPNPSNIRSGAYLLSRPLILVAQAHPRAGVKSFLEFMAGPEGQAIVGKRFVPAL